MVRYLIDMGADINLGDEFTTTSLVARAKNVHHLTGKKFNHRKAPNYWDRNALENSVDPHQTGPKGAL